MQQAPWRERNDTVSNFDFASGKLVIRSARLASPAQRVAVQFRGELFNAPNHFNWGAPSANISVAATAGRISSGGEARVVQFGLKLLF